MFSLLFHFNSFFNSATVLEISSLVFTMSIKPDLEAYLAYKPTQKSEEVNTGLWKMEKVYSTVILYHVVGHLSRSMQW